MSHFFQKLNVFHFRRVFRKNKVFFVKKRGFWMSFFHPGILYFQENYKFAPNFLQFHEKKICIFIVKLWTEILKSDEYMEFMENINIRSANHYAAFHHDHCMKSTKNPELLDEAFGEGNRFKASAPRADMRLESVILL